MSTCRHEHACLENSFDSLATNDVEQGKGGASRMLRASLQLRDIANRKIEIFCKNGLAHFRMFTQRPNFITAQRGKRCRGGLVKVAHRDFAIAAAAALALPRYPLLDDVAAEIGINKPPPCSLDSFGQTLVRDALTPREFGKQFGC